MTPLEDPIGHQPKVNAEQGQAWLAEEAVLASRPHLKALWLVEAPWAHPVWHSYQISLVDLAPDPAEPPPRIYLEGATHELLVFALDPKAPRAPVLLAERPPQLLGPANFAAQFIAASDHAAQVRVAIAVREICEGRLSPDTDARQQWIERFGDNMLRKDR